ncbi:MAG: hypothetical protein PHX04_04070 [Bacilli bacterium]|nr:hypothetical protein [Bacilli bacterium]
MKENFYTYFNIALHENKLPHAFLIETIDIETQFTKIINLLFDNNLIKNKNYNQCLNLIVIEPESKEIKSEQVNNLRKKFSAIPFNDKYNIYIIKYAEKMNNSSSNKILKFLEEPNSQTIGILLTANSQILPTIKSRCQIFKIINKNDVFVSENSLLLKKLLGNLNAEQEIELRKFFSKIDREELVNIFDSTINNYNDIMTEKTLKTIFILEKILHLLKSNVNIDLALDKLCIEVKKI